MTTQERIKALQNFGYDPEEARFLCVAALQSGYGAVSTCSPERTPW